MVPAVLTVKRGIRWFAPGVPSIHQGERLGGRWLWQSYRLLIVAALKAADIRLVEDVPWRSRGLFSRA
ncbi:hypothetical protein DAETH_32810 (plasmid) [Deinococcus aetherius]|uniref:Transposase n=1 Tax=Deinococcus aetherius TaxID=200252 RepID=A0ABM8AHY1_9DEIO|nr:hypothetical protein DAETH_32810 [Deinococcus aetherius]